MTENRIQAIRCKSCCRLRPHPTQQNGPLCPCGGYQFTRSHPLPGEEQWAVAIYRKEIEEAGLDVPSLSTKRSALHEGV